MRDFVSVRVRQNVSKDVGEAVAHREVATLGTQREGGSQLGR